MSPFTVTVWVNGERHDMDLDAGARVVDIMSRLSISSDATVQIDGRVVGPETELQAADVLRVHPKPGKLG